MLTFKQFTTEAYTMQKAPHEQQNASDQFHGHMSKHSGIKNIQRERVSKKTPTPSMTIWPHKGADKASVMSHVAKHLGKPVKKDVKDLHAVTQHTWHYKNGASVEHTTPKVNHNKFSELGYISYKAK